MSCPVSMLLRIHRGLADYPNFAVTAYAVLSGIDGAFILADPVNIWKMCHILGHFV